MKWSLAELRKNQETPLQFNETLDLKNELMTRDKQILDLAPVQVEGLVVVEKEDYILHYTVTTTITLPSSRSLEPVELPMNFSVDEVFMTPEQYAQLDETASVEEILLLENQQLDLSDSVADNILLEIPVQVLTEEERKYGTMPSGDDWAVISEEEYNKQKEAEKEKSTDPRLADLSSLLEDLKEDDTDD
ncbi:YceD family protein [Tetragenococcus halophilus]|uniref:YceD family protein n=1 Tax=Tetragenococcus halophilus TaxID=51669 RepID=UPI0030C8EEFD